MSEKIKTTTKGDSWVSRALGGLSEVLITAPSSKQTAS